MSFWDSERDLPEDVGTEMLREYAQKPPAPKAPYNRYVSQAQTPTPQPVNTNGPGDQAASQAAGIDSTLATQSPHLPGATSSKSDGGTKLNFSFNQGDEGDWGGYDTGENQYPDWGYGLGQDGGFGWSHGYGPLGAGYAQGGIITEPTIAKLGEDGPEMVVPLNAQAGNKIQPDVLQGRYRSPRVS